MIGTTNDSIFILQPNEFNAQNVNCFLIIGNLGKVKPFSLRGCSTVHLLWVEWLVQSLLFWSFPHVNIQGHRYWSRDWHHAVQSVQLGWYFFGDQTETKWLLACGRFVPAIENTIAIISLFGWPCNTNFEPTAKNSILPTTLHLAW